MKRKMLAVAAAVLVLAGCASENEDGVIEDNTGLSERTITLSDGRTVTCIVYASYNRGGLDCDWDGANG